jgi:pimeloyl-ACP methyl ester carboxylesterase
MSAQLRVTADATLDAGEYAWWWTPRTGRGATKYPMLALHGAGFLTGDNFAAPTGWPDAADLVRAVARGSAQTGNKGIPVASHYLNGDKYANDTVMSRIDLMRTSIATRTGCSSTKVNLFGISMGGGAAVRYAALNPSKVASINVIIPMMSIINLRNSNMGAGSLIGGFANVITAAWGATYSTGYTVTLTNGSTAVTATAGTFTSGQTGYAVIKNTAIRQSADTTVPFGTTFTFATSTTGTLSAAFTGTTGSYAIALAAPLPSGADLLTLAPAIASAGIPFRAFYVPDDPYIDPADVTALATAAGGTAIPLATGTGHANGTVAQLATYAGGTNFSDLISNLIANGA